MDWKEKGYNGNHLQLQYIKDYFPDPANFEDFVYLSQVNHQWSMMEAIEGHRKNMPECMGSLYWQINDCWPTMSWASIDYFGNWKASHYQAKRSFEKFIIANDKSTEGLKLYIVSDSTETFDAVLNLKWVGTNGETATSVNIPVRVKANTSGMIAELNYSKDEIPLPSDKNILWAQVIVNGRLLAEKVILTCLPKELDLQKPNIIVNSEKTDHGYLINLTTDKPAFFIRMSLNEGTGKFSDNYFHLIPGESKTVLIETAEDLTNIQFINIKSLNDLKQSGI
jgi:beta-mannosidase